MTASVDPEGATARSADVPGSGAAQPPSVKVFADKRTNRVMVVAPADQMKYIRTVVDSLDKEVEFEEPLRRPEEPGGATGAPLDGVGPPHRRERRRGPHHR